MQVTWSVFPKYHRHLSPPALAAFVRAIGVDTVNLVVREGFWVSPRADHVAAEARRFVDAMRVEGVDIRYATTGYTPAALVADPTPLNALADAGIVALRLGYIESASADVRGELAKARDDMERLAALCQNRRIRAVYQLHHETLVASPSAAYALVRDLPADAVGVELDPGNQTFEGHEDYLYSVRLLGEYLAWCACKDTIVVRDSARAGEPDKGWRREWAPVYEGMVRWDEVFRALASVDFRGVIKLMPHYDEHDPDGQQVKLKREVAYLKSLAAQNRRSPGT